MQEARGPSVALRIDIHISRHTAIQRYPDRTTSAILPYTAATLICYHPPLHIAGDTWRCAALRINSSCFCQRHATVCPRLRTSCRLILLYCCVLQPGYTAILLCTTILLCTAMYCYPDIHSSSALLLDCYTAM